MDPQAPSTELDPRARALLDAVVRAHPAWLRARMKEIAGGARGADEATERAVAAASAWLPGALATLLATDPDEQRSNPLHVIRSASRFANAELAALGVAAPVRDEFDTRAMPDDTYALGPLAWIDLGQDVHGAGIEWGAWKAATVITRRRAEAARD
ncbi:MAG: hypothetical protein ACO36A_00520 [Ilumatobacteraceae bacterium]